MTDHAEPAVGEPDQPHRHRQPRRDGPRRDGPRREGPLRGGRPPTAGSWPLLAAALRAAEAGWAVFPVRPGGKVPAVRDWENAATTDLDRITAWWSTTGWNVAVAAGRSGLLVLDLDTPTPIRPDANGAGPAVSDPAGCSAGHDPDLAGTAAPGRNGGAAGTVDGDGGDVGGDGGKAAAGAARGWTTSGWEVLSRLATDAGEVPPWDTFTVATPRGLHLYFRQPDGAGLRNTQGALGRWIDTRGHGGYVLAPGSRGPGGRRYRVVRDVPVAVLPGWLHAALAARAAPYPASAAGAATSPVAAGPGVGPAGAGAVVVAGSRVDAYVRAVVDGEVRAVTAAGVGTRHTTLLRAARRLGHWVGAGALTAAAARAVLTAAAAGYLGVAGYTAGQVERDITDGLRFGAARPRRVDDLADRPRHPAPAPE